MMAEDGPDKDEKTEEATPRKLQQMAQEGNVPRSQDVNGAAGLIAMTGALAVMGSVISMRMLQFASHMWQLDYVGRPVQAIAATMPVLNSVGVPVLVTAVVVAFVGVIQARNFSMDAVAFKPERLNPMPNLGKVFPSKETFAELGKQVLKLSAVVWVVFDVVRDAQPVFAVLAASELWVGATTVGGYCLKLAIRGILAYTAIAALDYWWVVRKFGEDAKMSKQEIKDERKGEEGDPRMRQAARQAAAAAAQNGGGDLSDATVLVTNPTHYAVALRYDADSDDAPMVLAKGVDHMALELRSRARRHEIPMVENRPLARALYAEAEVGQPIPMDLYRAVAEVIAYVLQLRAARLGHVAPAGGEA